MKTRSEAMAERKAKEAAKEGKKPSAEERTEPLPLKEVFGPTYVICGACSESIPVKKLVGVKDDGGSCPECGGAIKNISGRTFTKSAPLGPEVDAALLRDSEEREKETERAKKASTTTSDRSDEPRPGGGSRATVPGEAPKPKMVNPEKNEDLQAAPPAPRVSHDPVLNTISIEWGKSTFPLAMMSNFTVGGFFFSKKLEPGADVLQEGREILRGLEKLADEAFDRQAAWYEKKLGVLKG